ncbi:MAG TPA: hypothetical protein PKL06_04930 [Chitinophagales bacterium]|nr:hypothetical protein [Chitinophagales bacterium]
MNKIYGWIVTGICVSIMACSGDDTSASPEESAALPETVTFSEHIAPIIYKNCTPCHRDQSAGPFSFTNYEEVRAKAKTIAKVTRSRFMPPWPADPTYVSFKDERVLTDYEISLIGKWVEQDCPIGDAQSIPATPVYPIGSQIGEPDIVIPFPDIDIAGNNTDHFFLVKVPYEMPEARYVKTVEFIPGNKKLAHHMNANLILFDPAKKKDVTKGKKVLATNLAESALLVQTEMDNFQDDGSVPGLQPLVCNYLPGVSPAIYPAGIGGFLMPAKGAFFINDYHFGPSAKDEIDSTSHFNIFFSDAPPKRPTYELLLGSLGVSPVVPALIIPANEVKTFTIDYQVQETMSLITVNPHMHLIGKTFTAFAITPKQDTIKLVHIPKWDFRWQYFYTYKQVVVIPAGSRIHVEATFDNTVNNVNNPNHPPQVIIDRAGRFDSMKSTNEMLQLILSYMPYQPGDEQLSLE